jgi:hypothetical protein
MTWGETVGDALVRGPLPPGFSRRAFRVPPGRELGDEAGRLRDAIVVVERGQLELECEAVTSRRFGPGSMIALARLPASRLRSVGPGPLVLVAVSRTRRRSTDELPRDLGSYDG